MPQVKTALQEKHEKELAEFHKLEHYADRYEFYKAHPSLHGRFCKSNFTEEPTDAQIAAAKAAKTAPKLS